MVSSRLAYMSIMPMRTIVPVSIHRGTGSWPLGMGGVRTALHCRHGTVAAVPGHTALAATLRLGRTRVHAMLFAVECGRRVEILGLGSDTWSRLLQSMQDTAPYAACKDARKTLVVACSP